MTDRRCIECDEVKPLSEFHKDNGRKDGYKKRCRACCGVGTLTVKGITTHHRPAIAVTKATDEILFGLKAIEVMKQMGTPKQRV